jgi:hypothetical protein
VARRTVVTCDRCGAECPPLTESVVVLVAEKTSKQAERFGAAELCHHCLVVAVKGLLTDLGPEEATAWMEWVKRGCSKPAAGRMG